MGQAKRRGTFEERQAAALERRRQQEAERGKKREAEMEAYRQSPEYQARMKAGERMERMRGPGSLAGMVLIAATLGASMAHPRH